MDRYQLQLADSHDACLHWWRERTVESATILHIDMHHDARGSSRDRPDCGNFLRHAMEEGRVRHLYWIVPASIQFLAGRHADAFLRTLPSDFASGLIHDRGRWIVDAAPVRFELRSCDDLPEESAVSGGEVSYDLDFHYHRDLEGPTIEPVAWMIRFSDYLRRVSPAGVFLATSLVEGYVPPTYRPVATWLTECLECNSPPAWSADLWARVLNAEKRRVRSSTDLPIPKPLSSDMPSDILLFFEIWDAYLRGEYRQAAQAMYGLPAALQFRPIDELLVAIRHERDPTDRIRARVSCAQQHFCQPTLSEQEPDS